MFRKLKQIEQQNKNIALKSTSDSKV